MHGIPEDLPLTQFVGGMCNQIKLGQFQIQFYFSSSAKSINVEGKWELRDERDNVVDYSTPHEQRGSYQVHKIIGRQVYSFSIDPPICFTLCFDNELRLTVYANSEQYESFSIHPSDIYI